MKGLFRRVCFIELFVFFCLSSSVLAPAVRGADHDISMTANGFVPSYLEVTVGDRVTWWNDDDEFFDDHSTHSYSYSWNSGPVPYGWGVYLDMNQIGTFPYIDDVSFSGSGTIVVKPAGPPPPPPSVLIPAPNRVDMVYDQGRDIVYISGGTNVLRYQLASDSFLPPLPLSGNLMGIDLSPDGNTLIVADSSANPTNVRVHVIDLTTEQSHKAFFPVAFGESGTFAVAFGEDGAALISSRFAGSGWVPLRRFDPAKGLTTVISTFINQDSMVSASGDGSAIIIAESNNSGGPFDRYDVATRTINRTGGTGRYNYECAASKDGSLFALPTYFGTYIYNTNFGVVTNIGVYAGAQPIGAAFHPAADAVFFPFADTHVVRAYSTTTWQVLAEYDFVSTFTTPGNHAFGNGRIRISPDGEVILVTVAGGVRYQRHGLTLPKSHRLVIAGSPGAYGTAGPISYGNYWLSHGTNLTVSVPEFISTNGMKALASGWTGSGNPAASGTGNEVNFTLTTNSKLTWNWTPFTLGANKNAPGGNQIILRWPSLTGKTYDILWATNSQGTYTTVAAGIAATPPNNTYQTTIAPGGRGFYAVTMR